MAESATPTTQSTSMSRHRERRQVATRDEKALQADKEKRQGERNSDREKPQEERNSDENEEYDMSNDYEDNGYEEYNGDDGQQCDEGMSLDNQHNADEHRRQQERIPTRQQSTCQRGTTRVPVQE